MSEFLKKNNTKKDLIKEIILKLHNGLSVEEAKKKIEEEVGTISSTDIAEVEQSLINEGMSVDIIKKFCNVHALLFESSLNKILAEEESQSHPLYLFRMENRQIEKITKSIKDLISKKDAYNLESFTEELKKLLIKLKGLELHYTRKEQLLFPYLEKYNFAGPSKVMWGKHNEIRELLKNSMIKIEDIKTINQLEPFINEYINPLVEEVEGMIFKEENILFPTSKEKLSIDDWVEILKESDEIGYAFIEKPKETSALISELKKAVMSEPKINEENEIVLPTGILKLKELMWMLNSLPIEITFIDKDDSVKYFTDKKDRLFVRTKSVIGRKVQNCHPPQSIEAVEKILSAFKQGKRKSADFWIKFKDKFVFIKFIAVRDEFSNYLGTIEITMDITDIKKLEGERRLFDET
ncbi:MAG: DUF438 domain-containing protein [Actinobacteria bacterium]|nr:DUF438 domain-containing protein [Cyanobacteriota bacterium]MCL5771403.1 DUF438 domain-containing protein [Actinomycetota bacterium]